MVSVYLQKDPTFIFGYLAFLPSPLNQLEEVELHLKRVFALMDEAKLKFKSIPGDKGNQLHIKFAAIMGRNSDVEVFSSASRICKERVVSLKAWGQQIWLPSSFAQLAV